MSSTPKKPSRAGSGANLLFKGVAVLELVSELGPRARLSEIAAASTLPTATAHRILQALEQAQLVQKDTSTRGYRLGAKLVHLARRALEESDVRAAAQNELERLNASTQFTALLAVYNSGSLIVIDKRDGQQPIGLHSVGQQVPLHASALGKAILAALPDNEPLPSPAAGLPAFTAATITDPEVLRGHIEFTRSRHYAVDNAEQMLGITGVSAPIVDQQGRPLGAIGAYAPSAALRRGDVEALGRDLMEAALRVAGMMGMNPRDPWTNRGSLRAQESDVEQVVADDAFLGASPIWLPDEDRLAWIDVARPELMVSAPLLRGRGNTASGAIKLALPDAAGSIVRERAGRVLTALPSGIVSMSLSPDDPDVTPIIDVLSGAPHQRYNSSKCDSRGRLWTTTMDVSVSRPIGRLHRLDKGGSARQVADGFMIPIGIAWSPDDRHLYVCDASRREIYRWRFDAESGEVEDRRIFARLPEGRGRPTGLAVDIDGFIWSIHADGWCVTRYDPEGVIERVVALPVPKPLDCCFGGDDMRTLYITTGRLGLPERSLGEVPWSGSILAVRTPVAGLPAHDFHI
jgi:sugar lactone lactonase YvrE/DNA-binding IclR family transcriptional regulator